MKLRSMEPVGSAGGVAICKQSRKSERIIRWACIFACSGYLVTAFSQMDGSDSRSPARQPGHDTLTFVLGNVEFLLIHELAHFLINEKAVPIIGPQENAADYIASVALIREEPLDGGRKSRSLEFLSAAADAFAISWKLGSALGAEIPYWGSHALSIQRYYQIACLLYGSDPVAFARVPEIAGLPETRAKNCPMEFETANRSIQWLLDTYGRQPGDPTGARVEVLYEQPRSLVATRILEEIQESRLLDLTLERLQSRFTLEAPFSLVMRQCGMPEAAWVPDQRELVICYELIDTIYLLSLQEYSDRLEPVVPRE